MRRTVSLLAALALCSFSLVACGDSASDTGSLAVALTDAPFPAGPDCLAFAYVTVEGLAAKVGDLDDDDPDGWIDWSLDEPIVLDLLRLRAGLSHAFGSVALPTGHCKEIRLLLGDTTLVFADGSEKAFKVPSGSSSGLKIKIKPELVIVANEQSELLLDLDLAKSFKVGGTGGDPTCDDLKSDKGKASFKPVIRAINVDLTGVLAGTVADADGNPVVDAEIAVFLQETVVVDDSEPVATTLSAPAGLSNVDEGEWALRLEPGEYNVYVRSPDTDVSVRVILGAPVEAGVINDGQAIILL